MFMSGIPYVILVSKVRYSVFGDIGQLYIKLCGTSFYVPADKLTIIFFINSHLCNIHI